MKKKYPANVILKLTGMVVILVVISFFAFNDNKTNQPEEIIQSIPTKQKETNEEITYTLPIGWEELSDEGEKTITLTTPEYKFNGGFGKEVGVKITINKFKTNDPSNRLDERINPPSGAFGTIDPNSIKELKIDGKRTVRAVSNQEGFTLIYLVESRNSVWQINFNYIDKVRDFNPNAQSIDSFISSVKFVDK